MSCCITRFELGFGLSKNSERKASMHWSGHLPTLRPYLLLSQFPNPENICSIKLMLSSISSTLPYPLTSNLCNPDSIAKETPSKECINAPDAFPGMPLGPTREMMSPQASVPCVALLAASWSTKGLIFKNFPFPITRPRPPLAAARS